MRYPSLFAARLVGTRVLLGIVMIGTWLVASPLHARPVTLIRSVTVIDVEAAARVPDRDVLLSGSTIARIDAAGAIEVPDGAQVMDGRGRFLMPGLFDAHVHITAGGGSFEAPLLAYGVTAVRDTGAATQVILAMRARARSGETVSPELFVTGAIIDGKPPVWPFSEVCETAEEGRAAVDRLADAGVDQIKVYTRLPAEAWRAVIEQAGKRGLRVTGHVPSSVTLQVRFKPGRIASNILKDLPECCERLRRPRMNRSADISRCCAAGSATTTLIPPASMRFCAHLPMEG